MSCRICLDDDNQHDLFAPCLCTGSSNWVHRKCLRTWIETTNNTESQVKCTVCKYRYQSKSINSKAKKKCAVAVLTVPFIVCIIYILKLFTLEYMIFSIAIISMIGVISSCFYSTKQLLITSSIVAGVSIVCAMMNQSIYGIIIASIWSQIFTLIHVRSTKPKIKTIIGDAYQGIININTVEENKTNDETENPCETERTTDSIPITEIMNPVFQYLNEQKIQSQTIDEKADIC